MRVRKRNWEVKAEEKGEKSEQNITKEQERWKERQLSIHEVWRHHRNVTEEARSDPVSRDCHFRMFYLGGNYRKAPSGTVCLIHHHGLVALQPYTPQPYPLALLQGRRGATTGLWQQIIGVDWGAAAAFHCFVFSWAKTEAGLCPKEIRGFCPFSCREEFSFAYSMQTTAGFK